MSRDSWMMLAGILVSGAVDQVSDGQYVGVLWALAATAIVAHFRRDSWLNRKVF